MSSLFSTDFIVICCVFGVVGAIIGYYKTIGPFPGFVLAFFLNIIGVIILVCLRPKTIQLPLATNESIPDQLKKYKDLFDSGAITEDEYNVQKGRLLKN
jgi:hypothetical protein